MMNRPMGQPHRPESSDSMRHEAAEPNGGTGKVLLPRLKVCKGRNDNSVVASSGLYRICERTGEEDGGWGLESGRAHRVNHCYR